MAALGLLLGAAVQNASTFWLPQYLLRRGMSTLANPVMSAFAITALLGAMLAGLIAWAVVSGGSRPSRVRAILLTVFGCLLPAIALAGLGDRWALVGAFVSQIAYFGWSALLYWAVADTLPARGVVVGAAIGGLMLALSGTGASPAFAWIVETQGYGVLFLAVGGVAAVGVAGVLLLAWLVREPADAESRVVA
jgi:hypothetical protein